MASSIKVNLSKLGDEKPPVYCFTSPFFAKIASLVIIFWRFGISGIFGNFFIYILRAQFQTWYINSVEEWHIEFRVRAKNRPKSFFCIHGLKNSSFQIWHTVVSVMNPTDFCHGWVIIGLNKVIKQLRRWAGTLQGSLPTESFPKCFSTLFEYQL